MRKIGKKGREWINERRKRIKELEATGNYVVVGTLLFGICKDCGKWRCLDLDHVEGREGYDPHALAKLDAICRLCHIKRHENNHMKQKSEKSDTSKKKANWQMDHACKNCKTVVSTLICTNCNKISI